MHCTLAGISVESFHAKGWSTMTGTNTSGLRLSRILKVILITLGSLAAVVAVLFLFRSALGLYAYRAQGFPLAEKDFMSKDSLSIPGFHASPSTDTTLISITLNHTARQKKSWVVSGSGSLPSE